MIAHPQNHGRRWLRPAAWLLAVMLLQPVAPASGAYSNDMESGEQNWTVNVDFNLQASDQLWHLTTRDRHSSSHSWWCGSELAGTYNTGKLIANGLSSGDILLGPSPATLTFWEKFNTEFGWDDCQVWVSTNRGINWTVLRTGTWGASGGWRQTTINLANYTNQSARIRFRFYTLDANANGYGGWFIDDVAITAPVGIHGKVERFGQPVTNASVALCTSPTNIFGTTSTDASGQYAFTNFPLGAYAVRAQSDGCAVEWSTNAHHAADAAYLSFAIERIVTGVDFDLVPGQSPALAHVTSDPAGATIYLDHEATTNVTPASIDLGRAYNPDGTPALHTLLVRREGSPRPAKATVSAREADTVNVHFDLSSATAGTLTVTSIPTGATVYVDYPDLPLGTTPITVSNLMAGSHTVLLVPTNTFLRPRPINVQMPTNGNMTLRIPLNPALTSAYQTAFIYTSPTGCTVLADYRQENGLTDSIVDDLDDARVNVPTRCHKGGAVGLSLKYTCRPAYRGDQQPNDETPWLGFRVLRQFPPGTVRVPAGAFRMGDVYAQGEGDDVPVHAVFTDAFDMDRHEVTKARWDEVYEWALAHGYSFDNTGDGAGSQYPVTGVNWYDCVKWCNARSEMEGLAPVYYTNTGHTAVYRTGRQDLAITQVALTNAGYRLPSEAEWEKAARGGLVDHHFPWPSYGGHYRDHITPTNANYSDATTPVGSYPTNGYGLYDMAGNVFEWCWDWIDANAAWYSLPEASVTNTMGSTNGTQRCLKGGAIGYNLEYTCRPTYRGDHPPDGDTPWFGFRTVRRAPTGMVRVPAGTFRMGDVYAQGEGDDVPVHAVYTDAFDMDRYEVTKSRWDEVYEWALAHGYSFDGTGDGAESQHPVTGVNWYDCVKWCNARSEMEGLAPVYYTDSGHSTVYRRGQQDLAITQVALTRAGYRLPSEAEWEKAARGGLVDHHFPWPSYGGNYRDHISPANANYSSNTVPVGSYPANGYGLYDMAGNIFEWCWDWIDENATWYSQPEASATNTMGPDAGSGWSSESHTLRLRKHGYLDTAVLPVTNGLTSVFNISMVPRDDDYDGLPNLWEWPYGLDTDNPADAAADTDGDGLANLDEYLRGLNPTNNDTDGDRLTDNDEIHIYGTDPAKPDTDGDTIPDNWELRYGQSPFDQLAPVTGMWTQVVGHLALPGNAGRLQATDDMLYVAAGSAGIHQCAMGTNPQPVLLQTFDTPGSAWGLLLNSATNVVVADGSEGILIIDPANPTSPTLGTVSIPGFSHDLAAGPGPLAYLAAGSAGIQIVDISNPSIPKLAAGAPRGVALVPAGMARIPVGTFRMGDVYAQGEGDDTPVHEVYTDEFDMDRYEVTKALWDEVYQWALTNGYSFDNTGDGTGGQHPVTGVNWYDCVKWCNARSERERLAPVYYTNTSHTAVYRSGRRDLAITQVVLTNAGYRLPSEAEWEKAARGGLVDHHFPWPSYGGHYRDHITPAKANYSDATTPVGSYPTNGYGLHDMAGNVFEWCWDWIDENASWYSQPEASAANTMGPTNGTQRCHKGGAVGYNLEYTCRPTYRGDHPPADDTPWFGFRTVRRAFRSAVLTSNVTGVATAGTDILLSTDTGYGLQVFSLADPIRPTLLASLPMQVPGSKLLVSSGCVYVACGSNGVAIVDLSLATNPVLVAQIDTPGMVFGTAVESNLLYIADGVSGVRLLDISIPTNPVYRWSTTTPAPALDIMADHGTALIAAGTSGLYAVTAGPWDVDQDGLFDSWELTYWPDLTRGPNQDSDGDGISNWGEYLAGTDPTRPDQDHDGIPDGEELKLYQTTPLDSDTDRDGILDGEEIASSTNKPYITDPLSADTDADGVDDAAELDLRRDPTNAADGGGPSIIGGRVHDGSRGIIGAVLSLVGRAGTLYHQARTDTNGCYAIAGIIPGSYDLKLEAAGYADVWYNNAGGRLQATPLPIAADTHRYDLDFQMQRGSGTGLVYVTSSPVGAAVVLDYVTTTNITPAWIAIPHVSPQASPLDAVAYEPASHTLSVRLDNYPRMPTVPVPVHEGDVAYMHFDLASVTTGAIAITTAPTGALVYVDYRDTAAGQTPLLVTNVAAGSHTLFLSLTNALEPAPIHVDVPPNGLVAVTLPLFLADGTNLVVDARSGTAGKTLWINGRSTTNITQATVTALDAGRYQGDGWWSVPHRFQVQEPGDALSAPLMLRTAAATNPATLRFDDADLDGMVDDWEFFWFGQPAARDGTADADADGISDADEFRQGTDPTRKGPTWWADYGIIRTNATANDYAMANQGQLKHLAAAAAAAMDQALPGGAGNPVHLFVDGMSATNGNYHATNAGQAKQIASLFYDRLISVGLASAYPWPGDTAGNDYAPVNIGQLKALFNFMVNPADEDQDGMSDLWEAGEGLDPKNPDDNSLDPDGDGLANRDEHRHATEPFTSDTDGDGLDDGFELARGYDPLDVDSPVGPAWWYLYDVIDSAAPARDYAAVNQGQIKWIALRAQQAMEDTFRGGAGLDITLHMLNLSPSNNYAPATVGQLKFMAVPFLDRMGITYPWSSITSGVNDHAVANIGQVKQLFAFNISSNTAPPIPPPDTVNLLRPANGGSLIGYTSQYSATYAASLLNDGLVPPTPQLWTPADHVPPPYAFTYRLNNGRRAWISQAVMFNAYADCRARDMEIQASDDGTNYTTIASIRLERITTAQTATFPGRMARYARFLVHTWYDTAPRPGLVELELYGIRMD